LNLGKDGVGVVVCAPARVVAAGNQRRAKSEISNIKNLDGENPIESGEVLTQRGELASNL